jgi:putative transposase
MLEQTDISERRACLLVELSRSVLNYAPKVQPENEQLQARMVELASERRRFGSLAIGAFMLCWGGNALKSITNAFFASTGLPG